MKVRHEDFSQEDLDVEMVPSSAPASTPRDVSGLRFDDVEEYRDPALI